jgi:hypothetical protein
MADTARLTFVEEGRPEATEVGHFMFLFRGVYAAAATTLPASELKQWQTRLPALEQRLRKELASLQLTETSALFSNALGARSLSVRRLAVESPLEIVMIGVGAALALAVILSGGTIKFDVKAGSFEASLPALGEGIKKLREALAPKTRVVLESGVQPVRVKLAPAEFNELMKFDPKSEKKGGFQRVLIGMQYRINRTTKELELSAHDVDVIMKYGRQPKKGGWQASLKKIFGKHFDLDA